MRQNLCLLSPEIGTVRTDYENQLTKKQEEINRMSSEIQRLKVGIKGYTAQSTAQCSQLTKSHEQAIGA
jgi:hypothetical protein